MEAGPRDQYRQGEPEVSGGAKPCVPGTHSIRYRHIAAVVVGNALEFYDFITYAFFAVYIGREFFPSESHSSSLLLALATFGAGFLTRPVGGIVIGAMGDRLGRRPAMIFSFSLMGVAIAGLALTPSYAAIGLAAPLLVLLFRLLQGFALGGEVGPTTAFLIEAAPAARRGFYCSLQFATQWAAALTAGIVGVVLARLLSAAELQHWGWRVAMLLGASIVPFGLAIRGSLPETLLEGNDTTSGRIAVHTRLRPHLRVIVLGLVLLATATIGTFSLM